MRDFEFEKRVDFIKDIVKKSNTSGIIFGNSGGKDCVLVGILCKKACDNTVSIIMPAGTPQNIGSDMTDALLVAEKYDIKTRIIDIKHIKDNLVQEISKETAITDNAIANISPRLRMTVLYTIAASENRLVAGTGNLSERHMGYFTKHGDGAFDFNPISDLTATEVLDFLRWLDAPKSIINKPPSAGLYEGQTDELEMGISYKAIDEYLLTGKAADSDLAIINRFHNKTNHKRVPPPTL